MHFLISIDFLSNGYVPASFGTDTNVDVKNTKINHQNINPVIAVSEAPSLVSDVDVPFYLNNPLICVVGIGEYLGLLPDLPSVKIDCQNIATTFYTKWNYSIILKNSKNKTVYLSQEVEISKDGKDMDKDKNSGLDQVIENGFKLSWTSDEIAIFAEEVKYCLINNRHNGLLFLISSHGGADGVIHTCADDKDEDDDGEYVLSFLYNTFYPQQDKDGTIRNAEEAVLCQIPKIFFIDACRGSLRAKAVINKQNDDSKMAEKNKEEKGKEETEKAENQIKPKIESQSPTDNSTQDKVSQNAIAKVESKGTLTKKKKLDNHNKSENFAPVHKEANTCKIYANADGYAVQGGVEKGGMLSRSLNKTFKDVKFVSTHSWNAIIQKISKYTQQEATMVGNLYNLTQLVSTEINFQKDIVFSQYKYNQVDIKNNQWELKMNLFAQAQYFDKFTTSIVIENQSIDNDTIAVWVEFDTDTRDRDNLFESIINGSHSKEQFTLIKPNSIGHFDKIANIAYITAINETKNTIICDRFESALDKLYFFKNNINFGPLMAQCDKRHNLLPRKLQEDEAEDDVDVDVDVKLDQIQPSKEKNQSTESKESKESKEMNENDEKSKQKDKFSEENSKNGKCFDCNKDIDDLDVTDIDGIYYYCYHCHNKYCVGCCKTRVSQTIVMAKNMKKDKPSND